jgi:predicted TPR repeat methyltransferase
MPFSLKTGKEQTLQWFKENESSINRVLDIGVGSGTYFKLIKENNVCLNSLWTGIEAWEPYVHKFNLNDMYDELIIDDIRRVNLEELSQFDVAIAGDVLEHMTKEEAICLVDNVLKISKTLIISMPIVFMEQGAYEGNPFEIHVKPDWSHEEVMLTWKNKIKSYYLKNTRSKIGVYWLSNF